MHFTNPLWLMLGLLTCVTLVWLQRIFDARQEKALAKFAGSHLLSSLTVSLSRKRRTLKRCLFLLGLGLIFVALARPQWGFRWEEAKRRGSDILFAVDTSKSMLAEDVKPNRITRAKFAVSDLVAKLDGDRVGLIAFAGDAFLQAPLTLDYDAFQQSLDALDVGIIPRGGTDIASSITAAEAAFGTGTKNQKVLVLITDGEDLEAKGIEVAKEAAKTGLKVFTIGVGSTTGELIPVPSANGGTEFVKDENGQFVKSHLDETTLKQIAEATGGFYAALGQHGEGLDQVYQKALAPLPKQELISLMQKIYIERFQWPLGLGLLCLVLEMMIGTRKKSKRTVGRPLATQASAWVLALLWLALPTVGHASPQSAEAAYKKGVFDEAEKQYQNAAQAAPDKPVLQFNYGAAAYKAGKLEEASAAFQAALQTKELDLQQEAYYNLGNTKFRSGELTEKTQPEETIKEWQAAVQSYEAALKLKGDDADAKFNEDLVKRKLEALQKKNQNQNKNQNKKNQDSKNQDNKNQNQPSSSSPQNQDPNGKQQDGKPGDKSDQASQPNSQNPPNANQNNSTPGKPSNPGDKNETAAKPSAPKEGGKADEKGNTPTEQAGTGDKNQPPDGPAAAEKAVPGQMTQQEAKDLLDSLKKDERVLPLTPGDKANAPAASSQSRKDW